MNFKQLDSAKENESESNKRGISIRKKIPLLNGVLVYLSMSAICIFTYIKSAQMISKQESMRQAVNELSGGDLYNIINCNYNFHISWYSFIKGNNKTFIKGNIIN